MKDWKTYAIIILAAWCAVLTFKNKNTVLPTEEKNAASESYARKCAIATALKVYGPSKDKNKERICYFNKAVDDYGAEIDAVLTLTKGERDGIIIFHDSFSNKY